MPADDEEALAVMTRSRRIGGPAAVLGTMLLILSAGSLGAAEPTAGPADVPVDDVSYDAVVTVTFTAAADGFGLAAGDPLAGAAVTVEASVDGVLLDTVTGVTGSDGVAVVEGVARRASGDPGITLAVGAHWWRDEARDDGCLDRGSFSASTADIASALEVAVELVGEPSSEVVCSEPEPSAEPEPSEKPAPSVEPEPSPEPIAGIAWDADLAVSFSDADGNPVAGADVLVVASRGDPDAAGEGAFHKASGMTGDDGTATLTGLPRALDEPDALPVSWWVEAMAWPSEDVDGCRLARELIADSTIEDPVAGEQSLELVAAGSEPEWGGCDEPGDDAPIVTITLVGLPDGGGDGDGGEASAEPGASDGSDGGTTASIEPAAVTGEWVSVVQTRADGATWESGGYEVTDDSVDVRVQAWGTAEAPSTLVARFSGPVVRSETEGDCVYDIILAGETTVEAAFATDPPTEVTVEVAEERSAGICGEASLPPPDTGGSDGDDTGGGAPNEGAPGSGGITPPPTDVADAGATGRAPIGGPLAVLLGIAGAAILAAALGRRRARETVRRR